MLWLRSQGEGEGVKSKLRYSDYAQVRQFVIENGGSRVRGVRGEEHKCLEYGRFGGVLDLWIQLG